jgi:predicted RNA-binding Zn ribbon-like protein
VTLVSTSPARSFEQRAFELIAGHPALDLVNTLDWRFRADGPEEFLESYDDLLSFCEQSRLFTPSKARRRLSSKSAGDAARELARVRHLREAAAEVLYAALDQRSPATASVEILETYFRLARKHQRLSWSAFGMVWELPHISAVSHFPELLLSLSTEALLTSNDIWKVRACGNPDCRWLFLDTSKNHTRRWCDMKICGNRMKARRFKALHRG